jgi:cytochrome c5
MKKFFAIILIAVAAFACSRKTTPPSEIIISNQQKQSNKNEVAVTNTNPGEAPEGKTIYTTRCKTCHGVKPVAKYTGAEWENILKIMGPKAHLTESETKEVSAYVMANARK